jgi:hypothetical protein
MTIRCSLPSACAVPDRSARTMYNPRAGSCTWLCTWACTRCARAPKSARTQSDRVARFSLQLAKPQWLKHDFRLWGLRRPNAPFAKLRDYARLFPTSFTLRTPVRASHACARRHVRARTRGYTREKRSSGKITSHNLVTSQAPVVTANDQGDLTRCDSAQCRPRVQADAATPPRMAKPVDERCSASKNHMTISLYTRYHPYDMSISACHRYLAGKDLRPRPAGTAARLERICSGCPVFSNSLDRRMLSRREFEKPDSFATEFPT